MNTEDSEFQRIEREATRGIPDAIHHTCTSESLEYITGWNDCRQAMLAEQPAQKGPGLLGGDQCDRLFTLVMSKLASKHNPSMLPEDLNPNIVTHHALRHSIIQAAFMAGVVSAAPQAQPAQTAGKSELETVPAKGGLLAEQPAQQEIDWKDQYEKQKRRADMWVAKYEADIGPPVICIPRLLVLEKADPVAKQPAQQEFVEKIISNLEPLLATKNQSWAYAENALLELLAATPQAQPAREPLTDEEMAKAWAVADGEHNASSTVKRRITRAIEAATNSKEQNT